MESFFGQLKNGMLLWLGILQATGNRWQGIIGLLQSSTGSLKLQGLSPIQYRHQSLCK